MKQINKTFDTHKCFALKWTRFKINLCCPRIFPLTLYVIISLLHCTLQPDQEHRCFSFKTFKCLKGFILFFLLWWSKKSFSKISFDMSHGLILAVHSCYDIHIICSSRFDVPSENILWMCALLNLKSQGTFTFIHSAMSSKSSRCRKEFFSLAMGPSASSRRHTWNLSQYPWFPEHGAPLTNGNGFPWKWRVNTEEVVLAHVSGLSAIDTEKIKLKYIHNSTI